GKKVIYRKDTGGNENWQISLLDLDSGRHLVLTDGKHRHESMSISRNGKWIAFNGNARDEKNMDIYLLDLQAASQIKNLSVRGHEAVKIAAGARLAALDAVGGGPKRIWEVEGSYAPGDFSPDDSKLLVQQFVPERETHWHVRDVKTGEHKPLTPDQPPL